MLSKKKFRTLATADMLVLNLVITKMVLKWWEKKEISSILVSNSFKFIEIILPLFQI